MSEMENKASKQTMERTAQFNRCLPDIFLAGRELLYVGAKPSRMQMFDPFIDRGYRATILEGWGRNVIELLDWNEAGKFGHVVLQGDVRQLNLARSHDVVMWWHGPEHVGLGELSETLRRIEAAARKFVILASPWGRYVQGITDGNPLEVHRSAIYPETLRSFGYETDAIGVKDRKGSNLLAWKKIT